MEAYDLLGKKLSSRKVIVDAGLNEKPLSFNNLPSGTYFIQVRDGVGNIVGKLKFVKN
jgi:hypothetical protein